MTLPGCSDGVIHDIIYSKALVCEPAKMTLTGPVESLRDQPVSSWQFFQVRKTRQHALNASLFVMVDTIRIF